MDARRIAKFSVLGVFVMSLAGCPSVQPENAITWGLKATTNRLTQTTPTEWQAVANKINELSPGANVSLNGEQATAIVEFIQANDLNSVQEVVQLLDEVQNDPNSASNVVIPDGVVEMFGNMDFEAVMGGFLSGF